MTQSREQYWKARALAAEALLESELPADPVPSENPGSQPGLTESQRAALSVLEGQKTFENETLWQVATRLVDYAEDRMAAMYVLKRAGYEIEFDPAIQYVVRPVVQRLLNDIRSGQQTIEFLSRPPKMRADTLPVGAVFTHQGRLFELKREPAAAESTLVCYEWNRDDRSMNVDRQQLVTPLGRVTYDDRRKQVKIGLLEIAQDQPVPSKPAEFETDATGTKRHKA